MLGVFSLSLYKLSTQILMAPFRGIFVKKEMTYRLAMCKLEFCWQFSSAKWNESMTVYSLVLEGVRNFSKIIAKMQLGVSITERIGRRSGNPLPVSLWILHQPYQMPVLEPTAFTLL